MSRILQLGASALAVALVAVGGQVASAATAAGKAPSLNARSWILIDAGTGKVLDRKSPDGRLPMASTTKMMTAYLALKRLPLGKTLRATDYRAAPGESLMGLESGQRVSVRDLLYGLILLSGNDAAVTLAEAVSGTERRFVRLMNRTARRLGLKDTSYENPVGLDGPNHFSSARDLASLGQVLMKMPKFRPIASSRTAKLRSYRPPVEIETLNLFVLNNSWARGIKTGHTDKARYVLVSDGRRKSADLIAAVVGAPSELLRDSESVRLLNYGFSLYSEKVPIRAGKRVTEVGVKFEDAGLKLVSPRSVRTGIRQDEKLSVRTVVPDEVEGPLKRGEPVGVATVTVDGQAVGKVRLLAGRPVAEPDLLDRVQENFVYILLALGIILFAILGAVAVLRRWRRTNIRRRLRRVSRGRK